MPYLFRPPTYNESYDPDETLCITRLLTRPRGYSVRVVGSTVDDYPGVTGVVVSDWSDYDYVYEGGHKHTLTDAEYTTLTTADIRWDDHLEAL